MSNDISVTGLDHIVVNCSDVERSLTFYCDLLGLKPERLDEWRREEILFPSVRVDDATIIDLLPLAPSGENVNHFCLTVRAVDFDAVVASGTFDVVEGPVTRYGARGDGVSLYVRDPDGTLVELRHY
ncbi:MAG TPA: VOC family protein [Acidimicrobiales bacterium]|jgi:catechol 2,3-dioxygenase-like lactoylglutathione lyase family enzyme|nr:VOC family protein [Acidimicrobiales bacterium]